MKKSLSILLTLLILLAMLPATAFAAKDQFVKISSVSINEVSSPAAGTSPLIHANVETKYCSVADMVWFERETENGSSSPMSSGDLFRPGYYYGVRIDIAVSNDGYFAGNGADVTATVNGKSASVPSVARDYITVEYMFGMCLGTVPSVDISLPAPAAGASPAYPQVSGTGYVSNNSRNNGAAYTNGICWHDDTAGVYLYSGDTITAGHQYTATVVVVTTTGYYFSSSPTVKVNGSAASYSKVDKECIAVNATFSVPAAHSHTDSGWKTDADGHWKICTDSGCGAVTFTKAAHADADSNYSCDVCAYALPKPDNKPDNNTSDPVTSQPDNSSKDPAAKDPTTSDPVTKDPASDTTTTGEKETDDGGLPIALIIGVAVICAAAGAAVVFVVMKMKANK